MCFLRWALGFTVGLLVGWGMGRIFAPESGQAVRRTLRARYEEIAAEARQAGETKRLEMQARYAAAKQAGRGVP